MKGNKLTKLIDTSEYDICPYCDDKMAIVFTEDRTYRSIYNNRYDQSRPSIYFYCRCCKARSPMIELDSVHIDKHAVKESMADFVNGLNEEESE